MAELISFIQNFLPLIFGSGGLLFAFTERKKRKSEQKVSEADALAAMQDTYKIFIAHTNDKLAQMELEIRELIAELKMAREEIKILKQNQSS